MPQESTPCPPPCQCRLHVCGSGTAPFPGMAANQGKTALFHLPRDHSAPGIRLAGSSAQTSLGQHHFIINVVPEKGGMAFVPPFPANLETCAFIHPPGGNRAAIRGHNDSFRPPFHDSLKRLPELHPAIPMALAGGDDAVVAYLHIFGHLPRVPRRQPGGLAIQDGYKTVSVRNLRVIKEKIIKLLPVCTATIFPSPVKGIGVRQ